MVDTGFPEDYYFPKLVRQYPDDMGVQRLAVGGFPGLADIDYRIVLPPDLDISPADFATAWNEDPQCQAIALARMEALSGRQMDTVTMGVAFLTGVAMGAAGSAAYEVMKAGFRRVLAKLGKVQNFDLAQQPHPPGTPAVLVIIVNNEE